MGPRPSSLTPGLTPQRSRAEVGQTMFNMMTMKMSEVGEGGGKEMSEGQKDVALVTFKSIQDKEGGEGERWE